MDSAAAVRSHAGRSTTGLGASATACGRRAGVSDGVARSGRNAPDVQLKRAAFFDGPYTSYRNTPSRVHCYLCLLGGGGLYAGLYHVAVLMTSVHTVLNAATANTS